MMSISGRSVLANTIAAPSEDGVGEFHTSYLLSEPLNGHQGSQLSTPASGITESTFNLDIQERVALKANQETSFVDEYVSGDVFGGRI